MAVCPMCDTPPFDSAISRTRDYDLFLCRECDLVWVHPMQGPGADWYEAHPEYKKMLWRGNDSLLWNVQQFFKDLPAAGGMLLDVGCGAGQFLVEAERRGYQVTGLDFNPEAVVTAERRHGIKNLFCGTLEEFIQRHPNRRFDVVTAFEVLEHVEAPRGFLAQVHAALKQSGYFALSVPYRERWPRLKSIEEWDTPPHHLTKWSRCALTKAMAAVGFEVMRIETGWHIGEEILLHHVRLGILEALFRYSGRARAGNASQERLARTASRLMRLKRLLARGAGATINLALKPLGATGMDMYALARKG